MDWLWECVCVFMCVSGECVSLALTLGQFFIVNLANFLVRFFI